MANFGLARIPTAGLLTYFLPRIALMAFPPVFRGSGSQSAEINKKLQQRVLLRIFTVFPIIASNELGDRFNSKHRAP